MPQNSEDFDRFLKKLDVTGEQQNTENSNETGDKQSANDELHPDSPIHKIKLSVDKLRRKPSSHK